MKIAFSGAYENWSQRNSVFTEGLRGRGHEVAEIQTRSVFTRRRQRRIAERTGPFLACCVYVLLILLEAIITFFSLSKHLRELNDADILFSPNSSDYSVFAVLAWGVFLNKPIAFDPHGTVFYSQIVHRDHFPRDSIVGRLFFRLDRTVAQFSDIYIVYSEHMCETLENEFDLNTETTVVYTGTIESRFDESTSDNLDRVNVLYWGNFIEFHGVDIILKAARELETVRFVFAGNSDSRSKYVRYAHSNDLENVDFIGRVPQEELVDHIKSADLVVGKFRDNPYSEFTITNKIAEAAYMGKPILTSNTPAIREVFEHDESAILCSSGSYEGIVDEISNFFDGRYDAERLGKNAYKQYRNMLSSECAGRRLESAFEGFDD